MLSQTAVVECRVQLLSASHVSYLSTHTSRCRKTHAVPRVMKIQLAERRSSRPFAKAAFIPRRQSFLECVVVRVCRNGIH